MISPTKNFSYWVGLLQSDGYVRGYNDFMNKNKKQRPIVAGLEVKDKILVEKFQEISNLIFEEKLDIKYRSDHNTWLYDVNIDEYFTELIKLDILSKYPPKPPQWTIKNNKFFGAYLAGLIDGDGDVRIKRKKYPQCMIRITSGSPQKKLKEVLIDKMKCAVNITEISRNVYFKQDKRRIKSTYYTLEFLASPKNFRFLIKNVIPIILLKRKKKRIVDYIKSRWAEQDLNL